MILNDNDLSGTETCLWEAMVKVAVSGNDLDKKAYSELLMKLGKSACMSYQEIGITPTKKGWIIHINACNESGKVDILIPMDRNIPVKILNDTRSNSYDYRQYEYEDEDDN